MIDKIPHNILQAATAFCDIFDLYLEYPEDGWISLNDFYDLNLWIDMKNKEIKYAVGTVYYVENGETRTQEFIEIFRRLI